MSLALHVSPTPSRPDRRHTQPRKGEHIFSPAPNRRPLLQRLQLSIATLSSMHGAAVRELRSRLLGRQEEGILGRRMEAHPQKAAGARPQH